MHIVRSHSSPIGGLHGTADVTNLQQALLGLAQKTGNPAINPGAVTGVLNDQTMIALQGAIAYVSKDLPSWLYLALQAAMIGGATTSAAKQYVGQFATPLAMAINTASTKIAAPAGAGILLPTPAWYQTTIGKVGIGVGVLGALWYFFFREPKPAAKAA